jgi:hypothetical protein
MPNSGNLFPATAEDIARGSAAGTWGTPTNAISDNGVDTTCTASGGGASAGSRYLVCRNFGLALAAGDTVSGITIRVEASEHSTGNETLNAQLQNDSGVLIGTSKALTLSGTGKAIYTYGGIADLWGATLNPGIVNHVNFGVRLWFTTAHEVRIDFATVAVEYVLAPVGTGVFPGPIFPDEVFPGPIFPGGGTSPDVEAALTGVTATPALGTLVAVPVVYVALTGIDIHAGSGVGIGSSGPVFPGDVFPGGVFPGDVFPSGGGGIIDPSGGVGYVLPVNNHSLLSNTLSTALGFMSGEPERIDGLTGVVVSAAVGSLAQSHVNALTGVTSEADVETVLALSDLALVGMLSGFSIGSVAAEIEVGLTGVSALAEVFTLSVGADRLGALTTVAVTVAVDSVTHSSEVPLVGVAATASVTSFNLGVALTGVSATAQVGTVESEFHKTLGAVTVAVRLGHMPKEGDVILDLEGASVSVGSVGILGVGQQLPRSPYRHIAPAPIPRRRIQTLEDMEREMVLMEE